MVNVTGENGYDNGVVPSDEDLHAALLLYSQENLKQWQMRRRLLKDLGYDIGRTTLQKHLRDFEISGVRKPPPKAVAKTLVAEQMAADISRRNGPNTVKQLVNLEHQIKIPRSWVRQFMRELDPEGARIRAPAPRGKVRRTRLTSPGVFAEIHADGHEKFSSLALGMGPVGIPVYAFREKWSGLLLKILAVPNARKAAVIGHLHLDLVEEFKALSVQVTVDHGVETAYMYANQMALRRYCAPQLDLDEWPALVALTSTHNIPIENMWMRLRKHDGHNIQDTLLDGKHNGKFNPNNLVHVNLFQWLWPQIVQKQLDFFQLYWNTHHVRKQAKKKMPSGGTPNDFFSRPEDFGGARMTIPVNDPGIVPALRETLPISREDAYRWVDDEFAAAAQSVYEQLGRPVLKLETGWNIFGRMSPMLEAMYNYV